MYNDGGTTQMMDLLKQIGAGGANLAHTFLSCDRTGIAHNDQMWSGITVASMMCGNDTSSFLECQWLWRGLLDLGRVHL